MNPKSSNHSKKLTTAGRLQSLNSKTIVAIVLVSMMLLLWGRVLLKGKSEPAAANAQDLSQQSLPEQVHQSTVPLEKVVTVKLDVLKGRHDILSNNIFSRSNWKEFDFEGNNESSVDVSLVEDDLEKKHQSDLEKLAKTLKLEAIVYGNDGKLQVFVSGTILTVGSVLTVKEGSEQYELVLQEIKENEALFTWNKTSITLKMTETVEK